VVIEHFETNGRGDARCNKKCKKLKGLKRTGTIVAFDFAPLRAANEGVALAWAVMLRSN